MRLLNAAVLAAAALLVGSVASAQGLGDAAAREKEKRKTTTPAGKPAKVFTESDLGGASVASAPPAAAPAAGAAGATGAAGAQGQPADPKAKPKTEAELEAEAEKERQKAIDDWRAKLDEARKQEQQYRERVDRIQADLNESIGSYSTGRARLLDAFEEAKKQLADAQARIAELEDQGRRSNYR
jgi:hypothetical protein